MTHLFQVQTHRRVKDVAFARLRLKLMNMSIIIIIWWSWLSSSWLPTTRIMIFVMITNNDYDEFLSSPNPPPGGGRCICKADWVAWKWDCLPRLSHHWRHCHWHQHHQHHYWHQHHQHYHHYHYQHHHHHHHWHHNYHWHHHHQFHQHKVACGTGWVFVIDIAIIKNVIIYTTSVIIKYSLFDL